MDLKSRRGVQLSIALSKVMYRSLDPKKAGLLHFMTMFLIQSISVFWTPWLLTSAVLHLKEHSLGGERGLCGSTKWLSAPSQAYWIAAPRLSIIWTIYTDTMPTMTNTDDLVGRLSICSQDQIEVLIDSHQTKQECGDNGVLDSSTR